MLQNLALKGAEALDVEDPGLVQVPLDDVVLDQETDDAGNKSNFRIRHPVSYGLPQEHDGFLKVVLLRATDVKRGEAEDSCHECPRWIRRNGVEKRVVSSIAIERAAFAILVDDYSWIIR